MRMATIHSVWTGTPKVGFAQERVHLWILVGGQRHPGAVHQHELEPAKQELRADSDDERGDVERRHQKAVDEAASRARRQGADEADPPGRAAVGGDEAEGGHSQRHHRGEREIDLAGDDDEGQRQRDDAELRRRLGEGAIDVEIREEDPRRRDDESEPHRQADADDAELAAVAKQQGRRRGAVVDRLCGETCLGHGVLLERSGAGDVIEPLDQVNPWRFRFCCRRPRPCRDRAHKAGRRPDRR